MMNDVAGIKIGFVGLGNMGTPMCKHISTAGYDVTGFVRNEAGRAKAAAINARAAETLAELSVNADVVFSAVSDDRAMMDIVRGPAGLAAHMPRGGIFVETSTVSPKASEHVAQLMNAAGINYLRCPVSGSTSTAEAKQLTVLASGPRNSFDKVLPILQSFSAKQYHVGEGDQARYLKLVLNAMVGATSALVAEALSIGRAGGIEMATMLEVVNNSAVASPLIRYKTQTIIDDNYNAAFPVTGIMKDLDIALSVAHDQHIPLPVLSLIRQGYEAAYAEGNGAQDFFVLVKQLADLQRKSNGA
jgi:3-hydroxyisobutyrate dehydrogenase-like beta-hydroxyacid dehydrogenase